MAPLRAGDAAPGHHAPRPRPDEHGRPQAEGRGLSEAQQKWLLDNVPRHTDQCKTDRQAHKRGQYPQASQAMANALGFSHFIGFKQIHDWVEDERKKHFNGAAGRRESAVAEAGAAAEVSSDHSA